MNKEAIDLLIEKKPKLKASRHVLERMKPGIYCIHRSWGFGQIKDFDEATNKLIIDFQDGKEGHAMDPAFCVDKLEILEEDDLLVRQKTEPDTIADMIKKQPAEIVIEALSRKPDGIVSASELETYLTRIIGQAKFKKWWSNTKKILVRDPRIAVPVKKIDPYTLRDEPLSPEQEILEEFYSNKKPKQKILLAEKLYQLSGSAEEIANDLPQIMEDLTDAVKNARQLNRADRLHGVWVRNDLARHLCEDVDSLEPTSASILHEDEELSDLAEELPGTYHKRFLDLISRVYPENWEHITLTLLKNSVGKFTGECITFLMERECMDLIVGSLKKWLEEQTFKGPVLYWIVRNRNTRRFHRIVKDLINTQLFKAILNAVDAEALQLTTNRRILLAEVLGDDQDLVPDLLAEASEEVTEDLAHSLLQNQGFENLSKRSLMARFIKKYPSLQSLISDESATPAPSEDKLIVSNESLEARKKEYEILISQKIPENKEAIATARDHGDLKENSEYKMARQDQDMLLAQKALLESEMTKARVTDFSEVTNDLIGIGSVVDVTQQSSGKKHRFAILGAWDSNPEEDILSYKTPMGQSLLAKKVGDQISIEIDDNEETWTIEHISRWIDQKQTQTN